MDFRENLVYAIIPARSGSKGVIDKNIRKMGNYPLISYSIKAALQSSLISRVIVSTDSEKYADIAKFYGAEVPFLRPDDISGDQSSDNEFFEHAISWFDRNDGFVPEYFVHLRPTTPLRDPVVIDNAITKLISCDATSLRSAHKMSESAYKAFEVKDGYLTRMCGKGTNLDASNLGRQQYPVTYDANGYVDVVRTKMIMNERKLHGDNVIAYMTDRSYEVDEEDDLDLLEYMIEKRPKLIDKLFADD